MNNKKNKCLNSGCIDRSNCQPDEVCIEGECIKEEVIRQRNLHNLRPITREECSALKNKEVIFRTGREGTYTAQTVTILDCPTPGSMSGWWNARTCKEDEDVLVRYGNSSESCTHISYLFHPDDRE